MKLRIKQTADFLTSLKENKQVFTYEATTLTERVIWQGNSYDVISGKPLHPSVLHLIQKVAKHMDELDYPYPDIDKAKVNYYQFSKKGYFENARELDINGAYWNTAYYLGYLSQELYDYGLTCPKKARLISLGALAKHRYIYNFDGEIFIPQPPEIGKHEMVFFHICRQLGEIMEELKYIAGGEYIFSWVDAIFLKSEKSLADINEYLQFYGMVTKTYKIDSLNISRELASVYSAEFNEIKKLPPNYTRKFFKPKNRIYEFSKTHLHS